MQLVLSLIHSPSQHTQERASGCVTCCCFVSQSVSQSNSVRGWNNNRQLPALRPLPGLVLALALPLHKLTLVQVTLLQLVTCEYLLLKVFISSLTNDSTYEWVTFSSFSSFTFIRRCLSDAEVDLYLITWVPEYLCWQLSATCDCSLWKESNL